MTTTTVAETLHHTVDQYVGMLRKGLERHSPDRRHEMLLHGVLGMLAYIVDAYPADQAMVQTRNLLAAEQILSTAIDPVSGLEYERELDPEQTGAPIPKGVEGHGEHQRGSMGSWS